MGTLERVMVGGGRQWVVVVLKVVTMGTDLAGRQTFLDLHHVAQVNWFNNSTSPGNLVIWCYNAL